MDRDILFVRWATFAGLLAAAAIYLFPFLSTNRDRIFLLLPLIVSAAGLLTMGVEGGLRFLVRRLNRDQFLSTEYQRVEFLFEFNRQLLDAHSQQDVVESMLRAGRELLKARGASFVPFDEWGRSIPALTCGDVPCASSKIESQRLDSPAVRQACKICTTLGDRSCILMGEGKQEGKIQCARFFLGNREVGMLNFYFDRPYEIDPESHWMLNLLTRSAGAGLEALQYRERETAALHLIKSSTIPKNDIATLLDKLLENIQGALDVDFVILWIPEGIQKAVQAIPILLTRSRRVYNPDTLPDRAFLEGLWESLTASNAPLVFEDIKICDFSWRAMLALPLVWRDEGPLGILLFGNEHGHGFNQRQIVLLQTIAGEAALLIENARLMTQVEFQAVIDERTRLAREIHDGLAQTLAFLKIQATEMQSYLEQGKLDRLTEVLKASSRTLNDAYIDARQAIDNLRRVPQSDLRSLLADLVVNFELSSGLKIDISEQVLEMEFSPRIQVQLVRIVQEALSNIRKHANAENVSITAWKHDGEVVIEVRDDGIGFSPETVSTVYRYGLRGMQERAEKIGAEFQIVSRSGDGTIVRLKLPVPISEEL
jgi:two-component system nitrate/nitrite sensor histidine kinase NarX